MSWGEMSCSRDIYIRHCQESNSQPVPSQVEADPTRPQPTVTDISVHEFLSDSTFDYPTRQRCWTISSREILETRVVDYNRSLISPGFQGVLLCVFVKFVVHQLCSLPLPNCEGSSRVLCVYCTG